MSVEFDELAKKYKLHIMQPFGLKITAENHRDLQHVMGDIKLKALIKQFRLVLLRGFHIVDKTELLHCAKKLGPLLKWEFGHVMEMRVHDNPSNYLFTHGAVPLHWDGAFHREPRYLLFHCIEAPLTNGGGETLFTNTNAIWHKASGSEREEWLRYELTYQTEKLAHYGGKITVPLAQSHPDINEPILRFAEPVPQTMLNPVTVTIENLTQEATDNFIQQMAARCYHPENCYEHKWQQHDVLIADNYALLHARRAFTQFSPRHLRRIQIL